MLAIRAIPNQNTTLGGVFRGRRYSISPSSLLSNKMPMSVACAKWRLENAPRAPARPASLPVCEQTSQNASNVEPLENNGHNQIPESSLWHSGIL
ncbi:hypothetical protein TNCV_789291 [Trichonephila clavipes]|nr:hypothetical protein TNCV_789291 [Trichonephila clavipes]